MAEYDALPDWQVDADHWPYPSVAAHRGAGRLAPENTRAAMRLGVSLGHRMVEFDVKLTRDGVAILIHDETIDRTTDGTGAVRDLSADVVVYEPPAGDSIALAPSAAMLSRLGLREVVQGGQGRGGNLCQLHGGVAALYSALGVSHKDLEVDESSAVQKPPTEAQFASALSKGVDQVSTDSLLMMIAIIAAVGIEAWQAPANAALTKHLAAKA